MMIVDMVLLNHSSFFLIPWFEGFLHCKPVYAKIIRMNIKIQNVDLTAFRHEVNYTIND